MSRRKKQTKTDLTWSFLVFFTFKIFWHMQKSWKLESRFLSEKKWTWLTCKLLSQFFMAFLLYFFAVICIYFGARKYEEDWQKTKIRRVFAFFVTSLRIIYCISSLTEVEAVFWKTWEDELNKRKIWIELLQDNNNCLLHFCLKVKCL